MKVRKPLTDKFLESVESSKKFSHNTIISGKIGSRKDSHPTKLKNEDLKYW